MPLVVGGQILGFFSVDKAEAGFFNQEHVRLAEALAPQAAVAIQNAQLYAEVATGREQLRQLTRRLVDVQEAERRALSRDLHDTAGQSITALKLGLGLLMREGCLSEAAQARLERPAPDGRHGERGAAPLGGESAADKPGPLRPGTGTGSAALLLPAAARPDGGFLGRWPGRAPAGGGGDPVVPHCTGGLHQHCPLCPGERGVGHTAAGGGSGCGWSWKTTARALTWRRRCGGAGWGWWASASGRRCWGACSRSRAPGPPTGGLWLGHDGLRRAAARRHPAGCRSGRGDGGRWPGSGPPAVWPSIPGGHLSSRSERRHVGLGGAGPRQGAERCAERHLPGHRTAARG